MKKHLSTILIFLIFFVGLAVLLYPTISNLVNQMNTSKLIANYENVVANLNEEQYQKILDDAIGYNTKLALSDRRPKEGLIGYGNMLNVAGDGVMGYIEIPKIEVKLPIFHGTAESVLKVGSGHMPQTSLPVGGSGTHCVLSGHRGLPSAKLFTDLDKMKIGDMFYIYILNEVSAYQVDDISIVLPEETDNLIPVAGEDYITLVTCTPYGINTHRMLVRGSRVTYESTSSEKLRVVAEAFMIDNTTVAPVIAAPVILLLLVVLVFKSASGRRKRKFDMTKYL